MRLEDFLLENAETRRFVAGDVIVEAGQQSNAAYLIKNGTAKVFRLLNGKETILAHLGSDELFGEMSILRFDNYTASVRAETDLEAYLLTPDIIHGPIRDSHPMVKHLLQTLVARMNDVNDALVSCKSSKTADNAILEAFLNEHFI